MTAHRRNNSSGLIVAYAFAHGGKTLVWGFAESFFIFIGIYGIGLSPLTASSLAGGYLLVDALLQPIVTNAIQRSQIKGNPLAPLVRFSAPACGLFFILLFQRWPVSSTTSYIVLLAILGAAYRAAFILIDVPLASSIGRFEHDSRRRNLISAVSNLSGMSARLVLAMLTAHFLERNFQLEAGRFSLACIAVAIVSVTLVVLAFKRVDAGSRLVEESLDYQGSAVTGSAVSWKTLLTRNMIALAVLNVLSLSLITQMDHALIYLARHQQSLHASFSSIWMITSCVSAVSAFGWLALANRLEKVQVVALCLIATIVVTTGYIVAPFSHLTFLLAAGALTAANGVNVTIWSILPDAIDEISAKAGYPANTLATGYFMLLGKLAIGGSQVISGLTLQVWGFPHSPLLSEYSLSVAGITIVGCVLCLIPLLFMKLTHGNHRRLMKNFEKNR